jgi:hypothetical protein
MIKEDEETALVELLEDLIISVVLAMTADGNREERIKRVEQNKIQMIRLLKGEKP